MSSAEFFQVFLQAGNWNIVWNLFFILVAIAYLSLTGPFRRFFPYATYVSPKTKFYFLFGLLVYNFAMASPLERIGHELFSMHMLQMSLLYIVMPPFLLLGTPEWMIRPILEIGWIKRIGKFLTRPLIILFLFNGLISLYHVPVVFNLIMSDPLYHYLSHIILLIAALAMWWPVTCPVPKWDRVKPLHKLAFIFANGVLLTPACALIMFANHPLFAGYQEMSTMFPLLTPLQDQQLGGVIMKITQEVVYITAIAFIFTQWVREQRKKDEEDLMKWKQKHSMATQNE